MSGRPPLLALVTLPATTIGAAGRAAAGPGPSDGPLAPDVADAAATLERADGRETPRVDFLLAPNRVQGPNPQKAQAGTARANRVMLDR